MLHYLRIWGGGSQGECPVTSLADLTMFSFQIAFVFSMLIYGASYRSMSSMAKPTFADDGSLADGGIDLNMEQGMAE